MGTWFLATGISQYLGQLRWRSSPAPVNGTDPIQTLPLYMKFFFGLGLFAIFGAVPSFAVLPLMRRLSAESRQSNDAVRRRSCSRRPSRLLLVFPQWQGAERFPR